MEEKDKNADEVLKDAGKDFTIFVTGLSMQALIALGEIANPMDDKKEKNMPQAKYMIDTLEMIKEKTTGNLKQSEQDHLDNILYHLRMRYIELLAKENK